MTERKDPELSLRLLRNSFFCDTGIELSVLYILEEFALNGKKLEETARQSASEHFRSLMASEDLCNEVASAANDLYRASFGESPGHLDSILAMLDGPLAFDLCMFCATLDPEHRLEVRAKCLDSAPRYSGSLTVQQARTVAGKVLEMAEAILFPGKQFAVVLSQEERGRFEKEFMEYLARYRDSSAEELREFGAGDRSVSKAQASGKEPFADWREYCRFRFLSGDFSVFPELKIAVDAPLTVQESVFMPRPAEINRPAHEKAIRIYDGLRYAYDRLSKPDCKLLNLHGPRGNGLSAFARYLCVNLASSYSRGIGKLIPVYLNLAGKEEGELEQLATYIERISFASVDELVSTWSTEPIVLVLDDIDKACFDSETSQARFVDSLFDLGMMLRGGGVVLVSNKPIHGQKMSVELELISLDELTDSNVKDWFREWGSLLEKPRIKTDSIQPDVVNSLSNCLMLWLVSQYGWEALVMNPELSRDQLLDTVIEQVCKSMSSQLSNASVPDITRNSTLEVLKDVAWHTHNHGTPVDREQLREMLDSQMKGVAASKFTRVRSTRFIAVTCSADAEKTAVSISLPQFREMLVAKHFLDGLEHGALTNVLGRPLAKSTFELLRQVLKSRAKSGRLSREKLKKMRENCYDWFKSEAVAVRPSKSLSSGLCIAPSDYFVHFRLTCALLYFDINRLTGDKKSIFRDDKASFSRLLKMLQASQTKECITIEKELIGVNLREAVFEDIDLSGVDFSGCLLAEARFKRCRLDDACLNAAVMTGAQFDSCSMRNLTARRSDLTGCSARYCDLSGANLRQAKIDASSFLNVSLQSAHLAGAAMSKSSFSFCSFEKATLTGSLFSRSNLNNCDFSTAKMYGTQIGHCVFDFCSFDRTEMTVCAMVDCKLRRALFTGCIAPGLDAQNSAFFGLTCIKCVFDESDFSRGSMAGAQFRGCTLRNADLSRSDLSGSLIAECDVRGADLTMTSLAGANARDTDGFEELKGCDSAMIIGFEGVTPRARQLMKRQGAKDGLERKKKDTGRYGHGLNGLR